MDVTQRGEALADVRRWLQMLINGRHLSPRSAESRASLCSIQSGLYSSAPRNSASIPVVNPLSPDSQLRWALPVTPKCARSFAHRFKRWPPRAC